MSKKETVFVNLLNNTTTSKTASSVSNNIPLVQLPVAAKADAAVAPTSLAIFQNVTTNIDLITGELESINTTNPIPLTLSNNNFTYRFVL